MIRCSSLWLGVETTWVKETLGMREDFRYSGIWEMGTYWDIVTGHGSYRNGEKTLLGYEEQKIRRTHQKTMTSLPPSAIHFKTLDYFSSGPRDLNSLKADKLCFIILFFPLTMWISVAQ